MRPPYPLKLTLYIPLAGHQREMAAIMNGKDKAADTDHTISNAEGLCLTSIQSTPV